jgi:hypothetical protein
MYLSFLRFVREKTWLAWLLCLIPVLIYIWVFKVIALNVNYVAFDDILILGIIPEFSKCQSGRQMEAADDSFPRTPPGVFPLRNPATSKDIWNGQSGMADDHCEHMLGVLCGGFLSGLPAFEDFGLVFCAGNVAVVQYTVV